MLPHDPGEVSTRISTREWVGAENLKGHICKCGCGQPIVVQGHHRRNGIPDYVATHCQRFRNSMAAEIRDLHEAGFVTANEAAVRLGIPRTTLRYLEGRLYEPVERKGKRQIRVFTREQLEALRRALPSTRSVRRAKARAASVATSTAHKGRTL